jgi:hypothetical protein
MIETIEFKGEVYPKWQAEGFAAQFAFPFASKVCKGVGVDVGPNRLEWAFPTSYVVDPVLNSDYPLISQRAKERWVLKKQNS